MADLYDPVHADPEAFMNHYVMVPELLEKFDISDLDVTSRHGDVQRC